MTTGERTTKPHSLEEIVKISAMSGAAGAGAMIANVGALMWLRTTVSLGVSTTSCVAIVSSEELINEPLIIISYGMNR